MAKILISGWKCERCSHKWAPRTEEHPRVCPKCKSPYWDKPRSTSLLKNKKFKNYKLKDTKK